MPLDKETSAIRQKGLKLKEFTKSDAWGDIKGQLTEKLVALADITTLSETDPMVMLQEIKVRKLAINLVMGWVREIEGQVNQHDANESAFQSIKEESVIIQF